MTAEGRRRRRRFLRAGAALLLVIFVAEVLARAFWSIEFGLSFLRPRFLHAFYPEIGYLDDLQVRRDDEAVDLLLLGGSVVHPDWGFIPEFLKEEITWRTKRTVRVHIAAGGARTSLDSVLRYRHLARHRFDLVIVYHGINDTRANNCPPSLFRDDYTHFSWYRRLRDLGSHPEAQVLAFPYTGRTLLRLLAERTGIEPGLSRHRPRGEWLRHGGDIKTEGPFEKNLEQILELARGRGDPVLLMTFAWHVPAGYSLERFRRRELDYIRHGSEIEIWGEPAHVVAGIEAHNRAIRRLAERQGIPLVDQEREIPRRGDHFNDICHLTYKGCARFVENAADAIVRALK